MARLTETDIKDLFSAIRDLDRKLDNTERNLSKELSDIKSEINTISSDLKSVHSQVNNLSLDLKGIQSEMNNISSDLKVTQSEIKNITVVLGKVENRLWLFLLAVLSPTLITLLGIFARWLFPNTVKF